MRIGIIGCGLIGQKRAQVVGEHRVAWAADTVLQKAEFLARKFDAAKATDDWRKVVQADDVDALIIATTHDHLASIALAAANAGKHFLLEKPAARTASELDDVIAAVRKNGVTARVGFNHRYHPAFLKAREIFDSGELGPLMFIRARYGHGGRIGYEKEWRAHREISGGGELIDQGMHLIDLSRWFLGDFVHVDGYAPTYFWDMQVDDNCFLALRTPPGQMAWLHATWTEWKNQFSFEIYGKVGKLHIEGLGGSYGLEKLAYYKMLPEMGPPVTTLWEFPFPDHSWKLEFESFMQAVSDNRAPAGNLADARAALEIVDRVYGASRP